MRALSIWCIKEGWGRGEVHVTSCLIKLESCLGEFSVAFIFIPLLLILINSSSYGRGWGLRFNPSRYKFRKGTLWISMAEAFMEYLHKCVRKRCVTHNSLLVSLVFLPFLLLCASVLADRDYGPIYL